mgnify:CR=1 FL=1
MKKQKIGEFFPNFCVYAKLTDYFLRRRIGVPRSQRSEFFGSRSAAEWRLA